MQRQALPADSRMTGKMMLLVLPVNSAQHKLVTGMAEVGVHKQPMLHAWRQLVKLHGCFFSRLCAPSKLSKQHCVSSCKTSRKNTQAVAFAAVWDAVQVMHPDSVLVCISYICSTVGLVYALMDVLSLCAVACTIQAQCQKDLKGLSKQIESKQADLEKAQLELQHQQKIEAAVQKRIGEAERRLQVCKDVGLLKED